MHTILSEALYYALVVSLAPMLAISIGAGLITLLQAVTQIQEQSMVHLGRIIVLVVVIVWGGQGAFAQLEAIFLKVLALCAANNRG